MIIIDSSGQRVGTAYIASSVGTIIAGGGESPRGPTTPFFWRNCYGRKAIGLPSRRYAPPAKAALYSTMVPMWWALLVDLPACSPDVHSLLSPI